MSLSSVNRHLIMVEEFVCFNDYRNYDVDTSCSQGRLVVGDRADTVMYNALRVKEKHGAQFSSPRHGLVGVSPWTGLIVHMGPSRAKPIWAACLFVGHTCWVHSSVHGCQMGPCRSDPSLLKLALRHGMSPLWWKKSLSLCMRFRGTYLI